MSPIIRRLTLLFLALCASPVWADGTVTHLSGVVSVQKSDGKSQSATVGSKVLTGDILVTGAGGYVRMEMTDGGEIVLRPDSQLKIEGYKFVEAKPAEDSFVFSMLKGGLRTVTGLVGKRGNKDAYLLKTDTATMGIRGTQFDLRVCQGNCGALADGTYVAVRFGAVQASSPQGSLPVAAGQVAYVPPQRPPVMLPRDPGIGFTPPAVIPKLDEKKKQSAPAAGQEGGAKPASTAKPAAAAPAEQKQETKQEAKQEKKEEAKQDAKPKQEGQGQAANSSQTQPAAAAQAAGGTGQSCSVE